MLTTCKDTKFQIRLQSNHWTIHWFDGFVLTIFEVNSREFSVRIEETSK